MHRAWLVDDLVNNIIDDLPWRDRTVLLRCSRRLFNLTALHLWDDIGLHELSHLLLLCNGIPHFDWPRFTIYAPLIRRLDMDWMSMRDLDTPIIMGIMEDIIVYGDGKSAFASLTHLSLDVYRWEQFPLGTSLLQPSIRSYSITTYGYAIHEGPNWRNKAKYLCHGVQMLSELSSFSLSIVGALDVLDTIAVVETIRSLPSLTELQLINVDLSDALLDAVAALRKLKTLDICGEQDVTQDWVYPSEGCFDHLERLVLNDKIHQVTAISILSTIHTLEFLDLVIIDVDEAGFQQRSPTLMSAIARSHSTLSELDIRIQGQTRCANLDFLKALLSCTKLAHFAFSIFCPMKPSVDGALLQAMTIAWPLLRSLSFQWCLGEAEELPEDDVPVMQVLFNDDIYRQFALNCPHISCINIPQTSLSSSRTVSCPVTATTKANDICRNPLEIYVLNASAHLLVGNEAEDIALFFSLLWPGRELQFCGVKGADSDFWDEVQKLVHFERRFLLRYLGQADQ